MDILFNSTNKKKKMCSNLLLIAVGFVFYVNGQGPPMGIKVGEEAKEPTRRVIAENFDTSKPNLTIPHMLFYGGYVFPLGALCDASTQIALNQISKRNVLKNYNLIIDLFDERCIPDLGVRMSLEIIKRADTTYRDMPPILIGPGCFDALMVGHFIKHYHFVTGVEHTPESAIYFARHPYSNAFVFSPSLNSIYAALPHFIKANGWSRVFLLSDTLPFWTKFEKELDSGLTALNLSLAGVSKFPNHMEGPLPFDFINQAVVELAAMDNPRVIVIITTFRSTMACFFYEHGLYGPDIVLLWPGDGYFTENDYTRIPNCTKQMVAEVLKSVIFFSDGSDFSLGKPVEDSLGLTPSEYENQLKERLGHPETSWSWFFWRRFCYSPVEITAHIIQKVDERLGNVNDTIGNWLASGENFHKNPTYIENIIREEYENFEYEGKRLNTLMGTAGFFQMQENKSTGLLQPVPVASFDPFTQTYAIQGQLKWRTFDGQAPFDRIHYVIIHDLLVPTSTTGVLVAIALLVGLINLGFAITIAKHFRKDSAQEVKPMALMALIVGNILSLIFVVLLLLSTLAAEKNSTHLCTAASFFIILGQFLINFGFQAKIQFARVLKVVKDKARLKQSMFGHQSTYKKLSTITDSKKSSERHSGADAGEAIHDSQINRKKGQDLFLIVVFVIITILTIVWFSLEPLTVRNIDNGQFKAKNHRSIVYVHVTNGCHLEMESAVTKAFLGITMSVFGIFLIRTIQLTIFARKLTSDVMVDIFLMKISIGITISVILLGGVVVWLLYSKNVSNLYLSVSIIALIITITNTITIARSVFYMTKNENV